MPQIVKAGVWKPNRGNQPFIVMIDRVGRKMPAQLVREHIPLVLPERTGSQPGFALLGLVVLQQLHHGRGHGDAPALAILGRYEAKVSRLAGDILKLLID